LGNEIASSQFFRIDSCDSWAGSTKTQTKQKEMTPMKTVIKTSISRPRTRLGSSFILIALVLGSFALSQRLRAVSPAPDGGYPGGNTAEGQNALSSLTTGGFNTAIGFFSLRSDTTGQLNTAIGAGTLLANTADANTATGAGALLSNISGTDNTADGAFALFSNTATGNTAIGSKALLNNTTGGTLGNSNGYDVGPNVAVGWRALESNTIASANTAVGYQALGSLAVGYQGTDVGLCTAVGFQALANVHGSNNLGNDAFGYQALVNLTDGQTNLAVGTLALVDLADGNANVAIGTVAGNILTSGNNNIFIGSGAGGPDESYTIRIGANHTATYIAGVNGATVQGIPVLIDTSTSRLGTNTSSKRFKDEIKPMDTSSEALFLLKPISFRYKKEIDPAGTLQFGLVAEDVEDISPDLVVRDKEGKPYSVRYDHVNAMLLNEFLKEHKKVQKLEAAVAQQRNDFEATIAQLKSEMRSIVARSEDQDEEIQKVRAQVELNKAAPQKVANDY
jgi:Chaperone of endosialidase